MTLSTTPVADETLLLTRNLFRLITPEVSCHMESIGVVLMVTRLAVRRLKGFRSLLVVSDWIDYADGAVELH